jgi:hypothetical protein
LHQSHTYRFLVLLLAMVPFLVEAQEIDYDSLLQRIDTVKNPVYKPVVSFSYGVLSFRGDVQNSLIGPVIGNNAISVNISTFVDRKHRFIGNFNYLMGNMSGNSYSHSDISQNLNFSSSVSSVGANVEYRFGPFIDKDAFIRPYLSLGAGILHFSAKGDLVDSNGQTYYYWSDGSIRGSPESLPGDPPHLYRDYDYETDLRLHEQEEYGLGNYSQNALVLPVGAGAHFRISNRAFFSLGVSYYYALSDMLDNVAYEGTSIKGGKGNDSFIYSHLSLHFDLFSDPTTRTVELLYADVDFDPLLFDDEDGDFVLDVTDRCPGTPNGVAVDSLGCPLDSDMDGVADYLDREPGTKHGAWVDEQGVTVSEDEFLTTMQIRENAMPRDEVEQYDKIISGQYKLTSDVDIPENFQSLDTNGDGYLSFDELLLTIDKYFDYQMDLEEVRQLNDFFFSQ